MKDLLKITKGAVSNILTTSNDMKQSFLKRERTAVHPGPTTSSIQGEIQLQGIDFLG